VNTPLLSRRARTKAISLTPLIDVVFILLMFFMLTSSFVRWQALDLHSPVASEQSPLNDPQLFLLTREHSLQLNGTEMVIPHYSDFNSSHASRLDPHTASVLLPHPEVDIQTLVSALETLQAAGLHSVSLGHSYSDPAETGTQ